MRQVALYVDVPDDWDDQEEVEEAALAAQEWIDNQIADEKEESDDED